MSFGTLQLKASGTITAVSSGVASYVGANIFLNNSGNAPLPTGCQAGDWLFIAPSTNVTVTFSAPSSAVSVIADMDFMLGSGHRHMAVWAYRLTATDITNGYVAITTNANRSQLVVARSSQSTNPVDVSNTNSNSGAGTKPASVTVGGVITTADGALLLLIDSVIPAGSATGTFAVDSGFTVALTLNDVLYKGGAAYLAQATKGATGNITATFDNNNFASSGAALIAVKP